MLKIDLFEQSVNETLTLIRQKDIAAHQDGVFQTTLLVYIQQQQTNMLQPLFYAVATVLQQGIEALRAHNSLGSDLLDRYYFQGFTIQAIRNNRQLSESVPTLRRRRIEAVTELSKRLFQQELIERKNWRLKMLDELPLRDHDRVFGRKHDISLLSQKIQDRNAYWLINLIGMGGLGKSTVAQAVAHNFVDKLQ